MSFEIKSLVGVVKSFIRPDPNLILPRNVAPMAVVGIGVFFVLVSMFLGEVSSSSVSRINNNVLIQQDPFLLLSSLIAIVAMFRYWVHSSVKATHSIIFAGFWFLGWTIYDAYSAQLYSTKGFVTFPVDTTAGPGLWTAGVGCAIILIGGLMMRFPQLDIIGASSMTAKEKEKSDAMTKICPKCAESIKSAAVVCRYCNYQYTDKLETIEK